MQYSSLDIKSLLEEHFEKDLIDKSYESKRIKAKKLLTHTRFDIAFKLLYLEMKDKDVLFAKNIYKEHIRAFSLGKLTEPGNEEKNSIEKFLNTFDKTFEDIKSNGFDSNKTLIPLSRNSSIANGAHRVASAIYLDKEVDCVHIESSNHIYNYQFFFNRNVACEILDAVATKFVEYADNIYMAFIWPIANSNEELIEKKIPNIVYQKEVTFNYNGAHNLLSQLYYGEEWLGNIENDFSGSEGKLVECFKTFGPVKIVAFQADDLEDVLKIKDNIREVFNVGKHSVHITDTKEEAIRAARMVFNDNSIHFLNYAKPNKYLLTHEKIVRLKEFIEKNKLNSKDLLIDSNLVLSVYGLSEANNTHLFYSENIKIIKKFEEINIYNEGLKYYQETKNELIYDQKNYFYFNDLKFVSFKQLYRMKKSRDNIKDKNDCKMMEALIENNRWKEFVNRTKQNIYYEKIKLRKKAIGILHNIGLYNLTRDLYRIIKGQK